MEIEKLKFPIGEFEQPKEYTSPLIIEWIKEIASFPEELTQLTQNLTAKEINWKYRPEGWKIKQVVHHCADSHMNSFVRFKLALTEDAPNIRPYYEDRWAELPDALEDDLSDSISLLKALHKKWVLLLKSLTPEQLELEFVHPEHGKRFSLKENIGIYAWHGKHHLAHIKLALESKGKIT